jgi:hypothetical protein
MDKASLSLPLVTKSKILVVVLMHTLIYSTGGNSNLSLFSYSGQIVENELFTPTLIRWTVDSCLLFSVAAKGN